DVCSSVLPVEILVALCLLVGLLPGFTVAGLLAVAASATVGGDLPEYSLAIWHGINLPLAMSFAALLLGILIYFGRRPLLGWYVHLPQPDARAVFERVMQRLVDMAAVFTLRVDNMSLQRYTLGILLSVLDGRGVLSDD